MCTVFFVGSLKSNVDLWLQVILKDLEVLAEIASSPAGQTEGHDSGEIISIQNNQTELHIPISSSTPMISSSKYHVGQYSQDATMFNGSTQKYSDKKKQCVELLISKPFNLCSMLSHNNLN